MEQEAKGIRYQSEHFPTVQGLMHSVNEQNLMEEHRKQSRKKATGILKYAASFHKGLLGGQA